MVPPADGAASEPAGEPADAAAAVAHLERLLGRGEPLPAAVGAQAARRRWPGVARLDQLAALALARSGAPGAARAILGRLVEAGARDLETLGLLARTAKDLAEHAPDERERAAWRARAIEEYRAAHAADPDDPWPGVNAAGLALLTGRREEALALARDVRGRCERRLAAAPHDYWSVATLAEVALIEGRRDEAAARYAEAVRLSGGDVGRLASTLRNARGLERALPGARDLVEALLRTPDVLLYVGHRFDEPGRAEPRLPRAAEEALRARVALALARPQGAVLFGSAACGADLLVLEEGQRLGYATHVVLPYERDAFRADDLEERPHPGGRERFERVLAGAASVVEVSPARIASGGASLEFANRVVLGLALAHARRIESRVQGLAVWDGRPGDGPGGTAASVALWRAAGLPVVRLEPPPAPPAPRARPSPPSPARGEPAAPALEAVVKAILFADVKGYSRLEERQVPSFLAAVLGAVGRLADEARWGIAARNTWGDGFHLVFDRVGDAARFALALLEGVGQAVAAAPDLPQDLALRVALHAGAVYAFEDPVTHARSFGGAHVTRAARLEPVTPAGQVYATPWFAALAEVEGSEGFTCEYVGRVDLAKGAGSQDVYVVRREARSSAAESGPGAAP